MCMCIASNLVRVCTRYLGIWSGWFLVCGLWFMVCGSAGLDLIDAYAFLGFFWCVFLVVFWKWYGVWLEGKEVSWLGSWVSGFAGGWERGGEMWCRRLDGEMNGEAEEKEDEIWIWIYFWYYDWLLILVHSTSKVKISNGKCLPNYSDAPLRPKRHVINHHGVWEMSLSLGMTWETR